MSYGPATREGDGNRLTSMREYVVGLLKDAGGILRDYFSTRDYATTRKTGVDFTTDADIAVDVYLREHLGPRYPNTQFLTEETAPDEYQGFRQAEHLWVIDPLDGTANFSRGDPHFAISVALVEMGKAQLGVVYLPVSGDTYWAQVDEPKAMKNGEPLNVSAVAELRDAIIGCDWAWDLEKRKNVVKWIAAASPVVRQLKSMGSSTADVASLAEGRIDAYFHSGLKPWDVAASGLLVQKAGGLITRCDGAEWDVFCPDILATNGLLHEDVLGLINAP